MVLWFCNSYTFFISRVAWMERFRGLVSALWMPWSKIWQAQFKGVDEDGFWRSCWPLCRTVVAQPAIASQCFWGRHRMGTAGWRGVCNRGIWYFINLPFDQCLPCHYSLKKGPHKWFVFCSSKMTKTLKLNCWLRPWRPWFELWVHPSSSLYADLSEVLVLKTFGHLKLEHRD